MTAGTPYDEAFFAGHADQSVGSARVVVPMVLDLVAPRSVVDVGCGTGAWLKVFAEHGVTDYLGIDGEYAPKAGLVIDPARFRAADLTAPKPVGRAFDLAVSLEVAEHLPASAAAPLVEVLTAAAPVVLFSASVPEQRGVRHINEQWPDYWHDLFGVRGYALVDFIRPRIMHDTRVAWWYRQNTFLYVGPDRLAADARLRDLHAAHSARDLVLVQREVLAWNLSIPTSVRRHLRRLRWW